MSFKLDAGDFLKKTGDLLQKLPPMGDRALLKLGDKVRRDANNIEPRTPHLEGQLRSVVVIEILEQGIAVVWFQMPYAAKWHEATNPEPNWSEAGVGPKYLESKLVRFKDDYAKFLATLTQAELKNA